MSTTRTIVISGCASGLGAATRRQAEKDGMKVIGVDLRDAEVIADLGTRSRVARKRWPGPSSSVAAASTAWWGTPEWGPSPTRRPSWPG